MDGARPVRRRRLPGEVSGHYALQQWQLPGDVAVFAPLVDDALDLRGVQATCDVELAFGDELGQRREAGRSGDPRRADPTPPLGACDLARDPGRQVLAVAGREPWTDQQVVDVQPLRRHEPGLLDDVLGPELIEVLDEGLGKLR